MTHRWCPATGGMLNNQHDRHDYCWQWPAGLNVVLFVASYLYTYATLGRTLPSFFTIWVLLCVCKQLIIPMSALDLFPDFCTCIDWTRFAMVPLTSPTKVAQLFDILLRANLSAKYLYLELLSLTISLRAAGRIPNFAACFP